MKNHDRVHRLILVITSLVFSPSVSSFCSLIPEHRRKTVSLYEQNEILECKSLNESDQLKRQLLQLGASYDRGYGASSRAREDALLVIEGLERCNDATDAARGIDGTGENVSPLRGQWQMIWTTASDVLFLQASPILTVGAIYQVFEPPIVTNIIDFLPRVQSLFPRDMLPNSLLRAKVQTRAYQRSDSSNRVGLVFEKVQVQPLEVLGQRMNGLPPLGVDLPKLPGTVASNGPNFFDVTYLDDELIIIRQNAPGGVFALLKVDSIDA